MGWFVTAIILVVIGAGLLILRAVFGKPEKPDNPRDYEAAKA